MAAGIYWWAILAVLLGIERLTERAFPTFWQTRIDPWFTPARRKQALIVFALVAFFVANFRAWDQQREAKEEAIAKQGKTVLDPSALYQHGFPVASIIEPQIDVRNGSILFPAVTASRELELGSEFEFRTWHLICSGEPGSMMTFGAMRQITYLNFTCRIEGTR
jgi:hypothetical protein